MDRHCFGGSGSIRCFYGVLVFDSVGFYMDFMSTTAIDELVGKAERR